MRSMLGILGNDCFSPSLTMTGFGVPFAELLIKREIDMMGVGLGNEFYNLADTE